FSGNTALFGPTTAAQPNAGFASCYKGFAGREGFAGFVSCYKGFAGLIFAPRCSQIDWLAGRKLAPL
ncbi:hypothetical protein, partial [Pseudomonas prosekii]|uniref:hypothetical protein n=1 Tax=Pseudomonas prosekii TaxID=1148509 RepID=UPI001C6270E2